VNLEAAKDELAANTVTAIESVRLLSEEAVAGLRKSVNGNKATTVSALKAASDANAKARAVISDDVKAVAALVDAVLECNAERKLYNASDEKCIDVLPPPPPLCGLKEDTPCDNCQQTMDEGQSSGVHWILPPNKKKPFKAWCDNDHKDGGWMIIVKIAKDTRSQPIWHWASNLWKTAGVLKATDASADPGDMKNRGYSEMPFEEIRFVLGPKLNAGLVETELGKQSNAQTLFNGNFKKSKFSRGDLINFVKPFSSGDQWGNQPNCNTRGINLNEAGGQHRCRWGITMNNENNCGSNDASIGFGCYSNDNCCSARRFGAGGSRWGPDRRYPTAGFILIR